MDGSGASLRFFPAPRSQGGTAPLNHQDAEKIGELNRALASWMRQQQDKGIETELRNETYEALWVGRKVIE